MAYTSDTRIKNLLKSVNVSVMDKLSEIGLSDNLEFRVFDESSEDGRYFEEGGLTFKDPYTNLTLGSNDAGWIFKGEPLVIVEGTYGTERGQFGDGQLNRFSHSTGVALNGYIGVTFIPLKGESYSKSGRNPAGVSDNIRIKPANIHKGFLTGALSISEKESGWFLVIDAYAADQLIELIFEAVKKKEKKDNKLEFVIDSIILSMKKHLGKSEYGAQSDQLINTLYDNSHRVVSNRSRIYTQNYDALTTSTKRDGHGMLGKNLVELFSGPTDSKYYAIFIRLRKDEIVKLSKRNSKEFQYIFNHPKVNVRCFDDLIFEDVNLKKELDGIISVNMFQNRQKELLKKLQFELNSGRIRVD